MTPVSMIMILSMLLGSALCFSLLFPDIRGCSILAGGRVDAVFVCDTQISRSTTA